VPPVSAVHFARSNDVPAGPSNSSCQTGLGDDETLAHATTEKSAAREKSAKEAERVGFTLAAGSG
jgi:hypothetical protein